MKQSILLVALLSFSLFSCEDESTNLPAQECGYVNYYYYGDEQILIDEGELSNDYIVVGFYANYSDSYIDDLFETYEYFDNSYDYTLHEEEDYKVVPIKFANAKSCEQQTAIIDELEKTLKWLTCTMQHRPIIVKV